MQASPLIWVLQGARAGDNSQARALAVAVGGSIVIKQLDYNTLHIMPNFLLDSTTASLMLRSKNMLVPPWPDLVIAVGKRAAPTSQWIKKAAAGKTKIVHIGRPRAPLSAFDLVITTPQYRLPVLHNVHLMGLPFVERRVLPQKLAQACLEQWSHLPRPWIMAAIGGQKYPQILGPTELTEFGSRLQVLSERTSASVILFGSPRSPPNAVAQAASLLHRPHWRSDVGARVAESYHAALTSADMFAVTSDSVSMASEVLETGKPVAVFMLPESSGLWQWQTDRGIAGWLAAQGLLQPPRDVAGLMRGLVARGIVSEMDGTAFDKTRQTAMDHGRDEAVRRVRDLLPC